MFDCRGSLHLGARQTFGRPVQAPPARQPGHRRSLAAVPTGQAQDGQSFARLPGELVSQLAACLMLTSLMLVLLGPQGLALQLLHAEKQLARLAPQRPAKAQAHRRLCLPGAASPRACGACSALRSAASNEGGAFLPAHSWLDATPAQGLRDTPACHHWPAWAFTHPSHHPSPRLALRTHPTPLLIVPSLRPLAACAGSASHFRFCLECCPQQGPAAMQHPAHRTSTASAYSGRRREAGAYACPALPAAIHRGHARPAGNRLAGLCGWPGANVHAPVQRPSHHPLFGCCLRGAGNRHYCSVVDKLCGSKGVVSWATCARMCTSCGSRKEQPDGCSPFSS